MCHVRDTQIGWARTLLAETDSSYEGVSNETGLSTAQIMLLDEVLGDLDDGTVALVLEEIPFAATKEQALETALVLMFWY